PTVARALHSTAAGEKTPSSELLATDLQSLLQGIDRALLLSHARSKEGLEALAAQRDLAAARVKVVRHNVESLRQLTPPTRVLAPADGRVIRVGVKPGDRVDTTSRAATLLCVLAPTTHVRVTFEMDEAALERLDRVLRAPKSSDRASAEVTIRLDLPG